MGPLDDNINPLIINPTTNPDESRITNAYIWKKIFFWSRDWNKYCEKIKGGITEIKKFISF